MVIIIMATTVIMGTMVGIMEDITATIPTTRAGTTPAISITTTADTTGTVIITTTSRATITCIVAATGIGSYVGARLNRAQG